MLLSNSFYIILVIISKCLESIALINLPKSKTRTNSIFSYSDVSYIFVQLLTMMVNPRLFVFVYLKMFSLNLQKHFENNIRYTYTTLHYIKTSGVHGLTQSVQK